MSDYFPRIVVLAAALATPPAVHAQTSLHRDSLKGAEIAVRGCVRPGVERGSIVLERAREVAPDGKVLPPPGPGLPTAVYSFDDVGPIRPYLQRMVEVRGRITEVRDSDIEIKPAPELNGELVAELPVYGPDVRATLDEIPLPVGTAGRNTSIRSVVLRMDVNSVKPIAGSCVR